MCFTAAVYIGAKDAWFDKWARTELEPSGFANDGTKWAQADALEKVTALIIRGTTNPQAEQLETWAGYHSQSEHISALRKVASAWRATNTEYAGGIVLIWNGRAFGWKDSLRDPHWECPNTLAVDEDGNVYRAEGGDEYYGANYGQFMGNADQNLRQFKSDPAAIAVRIYKLADESNIPRRGLAQWLADQCGISYKATHKWLRGDTAPSLSNVEVIAFSLASSPSYILFGEAAAAPCPQDAPVEIRALARMYMADELGSDDLQEIVRFARLLARKNKIASEGLERTSALDD